MSWRSWRPSSSRIAFVAKHSNWEGRRQHIRQARTGRRGRAVHILLRLALASLKAAQSIGLGAVLPLSVGQLSPFRFDSTIAANPLSAVSARR
jgi:hypothetical protein